MRIRLAALALLTAALPLATLDPIHAQSRSSKDDIWQPAATPSGGVSWKVLEASKEITRLDAEGFILSKPVFAEQVKALAGKRIKVAGWMDAFNPGRTQTHFLLMAYPPGCPYHFHAAPNQYIEIKASRPFPVSRNRAIVVSGVLELTGYNESGIFYVLKDARPG